MALAGINADDFYPKIYLDADSGKSLDTKLPKTFAAALNGESKAVIISPFTSWKTKDVPVHQWVDAAELILTQHPGSRFIFTATPDKYEELEELLNAATAKRTQLRDHLLNFAGKTNIQELLHLISRADLVFASEGAAGHMASALDTPLAVVFGPTRPSRVGPWGDKALVVSSKTAECLGCYQRKCDNWICMNFPPQQLADAAFKLLS